MLHSSQWGDHAQHGEMLANVKEAEIVQNMYIDLLVERTALTAKKARSVFKAGPSTYWSVDEAKKLSLIDKTLGEMF